MYYRFIFCLILGLLTSTIQAQDLRMKKRHQQDYGDIKTIEGNG